MPQHKEQLRYNKELRLIWQEEVLGDESSCDGTEVLRYTVVLELLHSQPLMLPQKQPHIQLLLTTCYTSQIAIQTTYQIACIYSILDEI